MGCSESATLEYPGDYRRELFTVEVVDDQQGPLLSLQEVRDDLSQQKTVSVRWGGRLYFPGQTEERGLENVVTAVSVRSQPVNSARKVVFLSPSKLQGQTGLTHSSQSTDGLELRSC